MRHALWLGSLGVVLAGLFGMHGLDSHGMPGMEAAQSDMSFPDMAALSGHGVMSSAAAHEVASLATAGVVASGHLAIDAGMGLMCVAILAVALLALLRALRSRRTRRLLWMLTRPARAPAFQGRDPDPPSLIVLSIQRC